MVAGELLRQLTKLPGVRVREIIDRLVRHAEILSLKGGSHRLKDRDLKPSPGESPLNGRQLELGVSFRCTTVQDAE